MLNDGSLLSLKLG
jgi:hypothetical protein